MDKMHTGIATRNKCIATSSKKAIGHRSLLLGTSASLLVQEATPGLSPSLKVVPTKYSRCLHLSRSWSEHGTLFTKSPRRTVGRAKETGSMPIDETFRKRGLQSHAQRSFFLQRSASARSAVLGLRMRRLRLLWCCWRRRRHHHQISNGR